MICPPKWEMIDAVFSKALVKHDWLILEFLNIDGIDSSNYTISSIESEISTSKLSLRSASSSPSKSVSTVILGAERLGFKL